MVRPKGRSSQQPAVVAQTPIFEYGRWLYENSVWLQRTVIDASGRRGLVLEVNLSLKKPGLPTAGEKFTVIYYGKDDTLDPSTITKISGKVLARIKQDSWETFPPESPFVNDPDVEFVAAPGAEVGWRWTEDHYNQQVAWAAKRRAQLEQQVDLVLARMNGTKVTKLERELQAAGVPEPHIPLAIVQQQQAAWLKQQQAHKQQQLQAWLKQQQEGSSSQQPQEGSKEGSSTEVDSRAEVLDKMDGRCYGPPVELYYQQKAAKERASKQQAGEGVMGEQQQAGEAAAPKNRAKKARKCGS